MMCERPYSPFSGVHVGCGRCLFCRINKSREWQHRIMLEASSWEASCFATLTYDEMYLPDEFVDHKGNWWPRYSVNPRALQLFMKRLREKMRPIKIKFYGVGEYGDPQEDEIHGLGRPHYHVMLFGVGVEYGLCDEGNEVVAYSLGGVVEDCWKCGFVHIGEITSQSARYVTNYVTKFMNFETSDKLKGRHPEFSRMSNRPGIGVSGVEQMAKSISLSDYSKRKIIAEIPYGKKKYPLGRYLRTKLHDLRGGDSNAEIYESRHRSLELSTGYGEFLNSRFVQKSIELPHRDCDGSGSKCYGDFTVRNFHLHKDHPKRFRFKENEKQFKKRRRL